MVLVPFVFVALAPALPPDAGSPAARASGVIAQKARMPNRYSLRLRVEGRIPNAPPPLESAWSSTLHLWRDGNKFRVDHLDAEYTPPRQRHDRRDRHITCENCEREGYGIETKVMPGPPPTQPMVEFHPLGSRNLDGYCTHFDWRYFGLSNDGRCLYPRLQVAVDLPKFFNLSGVVTRTENWRDLPCLVASRKMPNLDRSVWLSERDEYNPVYFHDRYEVGDMPETRTTEISWQRTPGGHLYPRSVKHNTMIIVAGGKYASEEVATVTHADFDSPIDPAVFTLAGLGLNENQAVGLPGLDHLDRPVWRGGKLDPTYTVRTQLEERAKQSGGEARDAASPTPLATYPSQDNTTRIIGIVAAVLAVIAAVLAVVVRRKRASA